MGRWRACPEMPYTHAVKDSDSLHVHIPMAANAVRSAVPAHLNAHCSNAQLCELLVRTLIRTCLAVH